MRKRKSPTTVVSGRVSAQLLAEIEKTAKELDISKCKYAGQLLAFAMNPKNSLKQLEERALDVEALLEQSEETIKKLKESSPWQTEPFKTKLDQILKNEEILAKLYKVYVRKAFPYEVLDQGGFQENAFMGLMWGKKLVYRFMGNYGWAFVDETNTEVMLRYNK